MKKKESDSNAIFEQGKEMCSRLSRRDFLKSTGASVALLTVPMGLTGCDEVAQLPEIPPPTGSTTVSIVQRDDILEMVAEAINSAGGLDEIKPDDKVVIKPNLTAANNIFTNFNARVTTHPEVIRGVIRAVKEKTSPSNITVADACAFNLSTKNVAKSIGLDDVISDEGVNFAAWETSPYISVTHEDFDHIDFDLRVPESLYTNDHFINVPLLKNHDMVQGANADFTCCIKNNVGVLHPFNRFQGGDGIHNANLGEMCAELNLAIPIHTMNIVDALSVILSGGPASTNMSYVTPGFIFAGKDRVACDSVGVAILKYYGKLMGVDRPYINKSVWQQAQLTRAIELNLGRSKEFINIENFGVDHFDDIMNEWI